MKIAPLTANSVPIASALPHIILFPSLTPQRNKQDYADTENHTSNILPLFTCLPCIYNKEDVFSVCYLVSLKSATGPAFALLEMVSPL